MRGIGLGRASTCHNIVIRMQVFRLYVAQGRKPGIDRGDLRLSNSFRLREARMGTIRAGRIKQLSAATDEAVPFEAHSQRSCQRLVIEGHFLNRKVATILCNVEAVNGLLRDACTLGLRGPVARNHGHTCSCESAPAWSELTE